MKERKRFLLYYDWENLIQDMSDEDIASLTRGIFKYQNTWEISDMTYWAKLAFWFMRPVFDEDKKDWEEIREIRKKAGSEWWKAKANASKTKQSVANASKTKQNIPVIDIDSVSGIDTVTVIDTTETISKDIGEQALEPIKEYWDKEINKTLEFIQRYVWCDTFAESNKLQRQYGRHIFNLWKKIWSEEMKIRLDEILSDKFKAKNCNKIAYIYKELKSFIHSPQSSEIAKF